jgi:hypothetical protein
MGTDGKRRITLKIALLIVVGAPLGVGLLAAIVGPRAGQSAASAASDKAVADLQAREAADDALLYKAEAVIQQGLKDPSSADFSDGFARIKKGQHVACGYVNAKNGFGAMAGASQWIVVPDRGIALVRGYENNDKFVGLWNTYCTGRDDRDKPITAEIFGIRLGSRRPSNLKPFEGNADVLTFSHGKPSQYLGVPLRDAWMEAERGRVSGGSASASGSDAYDKWRAVLLERFGSPSSAGDGDRGNLEWKRGSGSAEAQLSYNPTTDQTLLSIRN